MRVFTIHHKIVDIKHFKFCTKDYNMLLELQRDHPNLPLETEINEYIRINQLDLENRAELMTLNASDANIHK